MLGSEDVCWCGLRLASDKQAKYLVEACRSTGGSGTHTANPGDSCIFLLGNQIYELTQEIVPAVLVHVGLASLPSGSQSACLEVAMKRMFHLAQGTPGQKARDKHDACSC